MQAGAASGVGAAASGVGAAATVIGDADPEHPFCTIVEFEWDETFDRERFASLVGGMDGDKVAPEGRLSRIAGIDGTGARMI